VHLLAHVEAVGRRARLADVAHLGDHGALDGGVDVGVGEDEERARCPPSSIDDAQDVVRRLLDQLAADLGRAGERQLAQPRVGR
jgi:hypothetical protein